MNKLLELASIPTAPFREKAIVRFLSQWLKDEKIPYFQDRFGNLLVGIESERNYKKVLSSRSKEPLLLAIAHMDHPGFHITGRTKNGELVAKWHGGSPVEKIEGAKVWLATEDDSRITYGHFSSVQLASHGKSIDSATVRLDPESHAQLKDTDVTRLFGAFAFRSPAWLEGDMLYTKAADDLVGVYCIIQALIHLKKKKNSHFLGLISRAEEVGFIGTLAHLKRYYSRPTQRKVLALSLETSRQLPGAEIGKGPVVRLGDRFTPFSPGPTHVLSLVANQVLPGAHQRRIMDAGTCEATAAITFGLEALAISVPLGNYHNQSFEGGLDSAGPNGPAPEQVHLNDVSGMQKLMIEIAKPGHNWMDPFRKKRADLLKAKDYFRHLKPKKS